MLRYYIIHEDEHVLFKIYRVILLNECYSKVVTAWHKINPGIEALKNFKLVPVEFPDRCQQRIILII